MVKIDKDKCCECGDCVGICLDGVLDVVDDEDGNGIVTPLRNDLCVSCGMCIVECPMGAISIISPVAE